MTITLAAERWLYIDDLADARRVTWREIVAVLVTDGYLHLRKVVG